MIVAVLAAAIALAAYAASRPPQRHDPPDPCFAAEPERCFVSHGAHVVLGGSVARDRAAIDRALDGALAYWGAPPGVLRGWVITLDDHEVECNGGRASGCCSWRRATLLLQALDPGCPETTQLVHELGHVLLHDPDHRDGRWCWEAEQDATLALVRGPGASAGCAHSGYYTRPVASAGGCRGPTAPPR